MLREAFLELLNKPTKLSKSEREDSDIWAHHKYDMPFVDSDKGTERFNRYEEYFADKGVEIAYFSYTQGTSSTKTSRSSRHHCQSSGEE